MRRLCKLSLMLAVLMPLTLPTSAQEMVHLHRGINLFPWLYRARLVDHSDQVYELDNSFPYVVEYTPERIAKLRGLGFDFVRIPVDPSPLMAVWAAQRFRIIAQIMNAYKLANAAGLTVIIDFHPRESVPKWQAASIIKSNSNWKIYRDALVEVASTLVRENKGSVLLELMNEPPTGWASEDGDLWEQTQRNYVKAIRRVAPMLPLIVTGDRGGGIEGLLRLDPSKSDDPYIYYSFHYYDPMIVTHQGATWTTTEYRRYLDGIPYPPERSHEAEILQHIRENIFKGISDPAKAARSWGEVEPIIRQYLESGQGAAHIQADFSQVAIWARSHKIPPSRILLGEFGVYRPAATRETEIHYVRDVRTTAEREGFAWAFFNYQPTESLPAFSLLRLPGPIPAPFDLDITAQGLGLSVPFVKPASH